MENKISGAIDDTTMSSLEAIPAQILLLLPFLLNLTAKERKSLRKMATKHTGYANDVFTGVKAFPKTVPQTFSIDEFTKDMVLISKLPYVKQIFMAVIEMIDDTIIQLGHEIMQQSDKGYGYLKDAKADNQDVKNIVDQIATAYLGQGKKKPRTTTAIPAGVTITVRGVVPGERFINNGVTVEKFKQGSLLSGKPKLADIQVNPGDSEIIPKGWTTIEVTNMSSTAEGSFSVKMA